MRARFLLALVALVTCVLVWRLRSRETSPLPACALDDVCLRTPNGYDMRPADGSCVKLCVCTMTRRPLQLETWLKHHRAVGVSHFFLCVEDTPELHVLLEAAAWRGVVSATYASHDGPSYFTQMQRQAAHVARSISLARRMGMSHIAHIDDDELIHCENGSAALFAHLAAGESCSTFHVRNIEAVYSRSDCESAFEKTNTFCVRPRDFAAYTNGKSIGSLTDTTLSPHGPHAFSGPSCSLPPWVAVVAHFESACVERWREKFSAYARRAPDACAKDRIPFPFYCNSIEAFVTGASDKDRVWHRWRTIARHSNDAIVRRRICLSKPG